MAERFASVNMRPTPSASHTAPASSRYAAVSSTSSPLVTLNVFSIALAPASASWRVPMPANFFVSAGVGSVFHLAPVHLSQRRRFWSNTWTGLLTSFAICTAYPVPPSTFPSPSKPREIANTASEFLTWNQLRAMSPSTPSFSVSARPIAAAA